MNFPIQIDIDINQQDFIQTEILELTENYEIEKKSCLKVFIYQSVFFIGVIILFLNSNIIVDEAVYFPISFWFFSLVNFLYKYFIGSRTDYNYSIEHLIKSDAAGNKFFSSENGMIVFKEKEIEYLTNENRRYFSYDKLKNIKITKRLIVFVLKISKDKSIRGFHYMLIPKRCLNEENEEKVYKLIEDIKKEYNLKDWIECKILD